jgi:hypothetical protein
MMPGIEVKGKNSRVKQHKPRCVPDQGCSCTSPQLSTVTCYRTSRHAYPSCCWHPAFICGCTTYYHPASRQCTQHWWCRPQWCPQPLTPHAHRPTTQPKQKYLSAVL